MVAIPYLLFILRFVIFLKDNTVMIHYTALHRLYHVISLSIDTVIAYKGEEYVQPDLEGFLTLFFKSVIVDSENFLCLFSDIVTVNRFSMIFFNEVVNDAWFAACLLACILLCSVYIVAGTAISIRTFL